MPKPSFLRLLLLVCLLTPMLLASARADDALAEAQKQHLTQRGRVLLGGDLGGFYSSDDSTTYGAGYRWGISLTPSVVYFVRDRLGVGVFLSEAHRRGDTFAPVRENELGGGLRLLYDVPLTERVSVFVGPWLSYASAWRHQAGLPSTYSSVEKIRFMQLGAFIPLVYKPNAHFGFGLGPYAKFDFWMQRSAEYEGYSAVTGQQHRARMQDILDAQPGHRVSVGAMSTLMGSF